MGKNNYDVDTLFYKGKETILSFCQESAKEIGLEFANKSSIIWFDDFANHKHVLTICAKSGSRVVDFSKDNIIEYAQQKNCKKTQEQLKNILKDIKD